MANNGKDINNKSSPEQPGRKKKESRQEMKKSLNEKIKQARAKRDTKDSWKIGEWKFTRVNGIIILNTSH